MPLRSLSALAILAALSVTTLASAEERFPAGGLELTDAYHTSIAKEDVYLSIRQVKVHYEYATDKAETALVRFPMPIVPIDESPDHLGGVLLAEGQDHTNYAQFAATVNGAAVEPTVREFAYFYGSDVTDELKAAGVPLYVQNLEELQAVFAKAGAEVEADFVQRGLLQLDSYGEPQTALWQYQTVLEWEQALEPGTTSMDVTYVPLNGYPDGVDDAYFGEGEDKAYVQQVADFYCLDAALIKAVKKRMETQSYFETVHLGFATSQQDRKTPIGEFSLTVDKADTAEAMKALDYVAFCPIEAKKVSDTQFRWTAKDFTPTRDVDVVYYAFQG